MRTFPALMLLLYAACRGDVGQRGPEGPQGPAGQQGLPGPNVSHDQLPCPVADGGAPAMVDLGPYCIEQTEDIAPGMGGGAFPNAAGVCRSRGRRLCTYAEWFIACRDFSGQVMNMTDDPEIVDELVPDGDGGVKVLVVGNGSCSRIEFFELEQTASYRCCL
jgi:hypothetical protein